MLKKIIIFLLIILGLYIIGYYILYSQGAFQTKEEIYSSSSTTPAMKCEPGKCGASMDKMDLQKTIPEKKCVAGGKCAAGKCGNNQ